MARKRPTATRKHAQHAPLICPACKKPATYLKLGYCRGCWAAPRGQIRHPSTTRKATPPG